METKQTAVEWFYDILTSENWEYKTFEEQDEIYQKAKAMEKEQIEDAWYAGDEDGAIHEFEYYYNETFNK